MVAETNLICIHIHKYKVHNKASSIGLENNPSYPMSHIGIKSCLK